MEAMIELAKGQHDLYPVEKMRNYFLVKARLCRDIEDCYYSMKGLTISASEVPFLKVEITTDMYSEAEVVDYLGQEIKFNQHLYEFIFTDTKGKKVDLISKTTFDRHYGHALFTYSDGFEA
jgi:hypothetical protein